MGCLCCGDTTELGSLCRACAQEVSPCEGLISDHLHSTVDPEAAVAWAVDGFGTAHALAARSTLGRSQDGQLVALASSVSREHARLERSDAGWHIRDLGSRNGTFVDDARLQGRAPLPTRARLRIGDVAMWFLAEVSYQPGESASIPTVTAGAGIVRYTLVREVGELCLVGGTDAASGGSLLSRPSATTAWVERGLAPLEFQLLRALCVRSVEEAASPSAVRGCVATKQLAKDLPFQSRYANEENVRQVVRRVRGVLDELLAEGVLAVAPGRGYYIACPVTIAGSDRR